MAWVGDSLAFTGLCHWGRRDRRTGERMMEGADGAGREHVSVQVAEDSTACGRLSGEPTSTGRLIQPMQTALCDTHRHPGEVEHTRLHSVGLERPGQRRAVGLGCDEVGGAGQSSTLGAPGGRRARKRAEGLVVGGPSGVSWGPERGMTLHFLSSGAGSSRREGSQALGVVQARRLHRLTGTASGVTGW